MKNHIPFEFHNKTNIITVDYNKMNDAYESGFHILNLPFDSSECKGYPMVHAYFENLNLEGYERYCGWIQFIRREEYGHITDSLPERIRYALDVPDDFTERRFPYFALGYPPELFDAPCRNIQGSEKLNWQAYTYLVDIPSRINDYQLSYLAGFSWGYTENIQGDVSLLDFSILTESDWNIHKKYIGFPL